MITAKLHQQLNLFFFWKFAWNVRRKQPISRRIRISEHFWCSRNNEKRNVWCFDYWKRQLEKATWKKATWKKATWKKATWTVPGEHTCSQPVLTNPCPFFSHIYFAFLETKTKNPKKCLSLSTFSTQVSLARKPSTRRSDSCRAQTVSSWTSNAQTASRSEPSLATLSPSSSAKDAAASCPSLQIV